MSSIEFAFENPLFLLFSIPAFAIILIPFFLLPKRRRKTVKKILPVVLHVVIASLLILVLSGFHVITHTDDQAVMLLVDLSDSTGTVQDQIKEKAGELLSLMDENVPVGAVVFGNDQLYTLKMNTGNRELSVSPIRADATDIDTALEYAADLLPSDKAGRIILLGDGKETDGDASSTAHYLATRGIRVDAVYFDTTELDTAEIQVSSFLAPQGAYVGETISFSVELKSNTVGTANLKLYDNDGEMVAYAVVEVSPGTSVFPLEVDAEVSGTHAYHLVMESMYDTIPQNNESYAYLRVVGSPSILIIADQPARAEALKNILSQENTVAVTSAKTAPKSIVELCKYDEVFLSNVDFEDLPEGYDALLEQYVSSYGKTVLAVGGSETYMYGNMEETKLEEMMPVSFTVSESTEGKSVALMLVLDNSNSMSNNGATYFSVAKQGAIKCVEVMTENDFVGIVSFNGSAVLQSPLVRASEGNKASLTRTISGLTTQTGTVYSTAIQTAREELEKIDADVKHILFLSDGRPSDKNYYRATQRANQAGITVSTIGLGYSSDILEKMAEYGGGRYYYVKTATDLPDIMLSETKQVTIDSLITGSFIPLVERESQVTASLDGGALPKLEGYLGTTVKEDATAFFVTDKGHPIFATWSYGLGTVAAFTSDLNGDWSSAWLSDAAGQEVIKGMAKAIFNKTFQDSSLSLSASAHSKTMELLVATSGSSPQNTVTVTVSKGDQSGEYALVQTASGVYETIIPVVGEGIYEMKIVEKDPKGEDVDYLDTAVAVSYSREYDAFAQGGQDLLETLCSYSGGAVFTDMASLALAQVSAVGRIWNPMILFALLSAILLLVDIAVRKLRWKDVRNHLVKLKLISSR